MENLKKRAYHDFSAVSCRFSKMEIIRPYCWSVGLVHKPGEGLNMSMALRILVWVGVSFGAALIGGVGTAVGLGAWYDGLNKPGWTPPSWVFGPVWTTLYTLMGLSMALMDSATSVAGREGANRRLRTIFVVQIILNALWPVVFFAGGWLWGGLVVIVSLEVVIVAWIVQGWAVHRLATGMILPYALWVGFASGLNAAIAWLN